jgi:hypothetical protein
VEIYHKGRTLHHFRIHLGPDSRPCAADCDCGAHWTADNPGLGAAPWGMTHIAPPFLCTGSGDPVHVGRTDGHGSCRTECPTCRRFVDTSVIEGNCAFRTIDRHPARQATT